MLFRQLRDSHLAQNAYLIGCQATGEALLVDPERDVDRYVEAAEREGLRVTAVAETHIHADFVSGSREMASRSDVDLYLSAQGGEDWSYRWADRSSPRVRLVGDGDRFAIGKIEISVLHTPGHTPEHVAFLVTDAGGGASEPMGILSGDFVFVGDVGRPDLLETAAGQRGAMRPAARELFRSLPRFLELADHVQVWPAHGAGSACGKALGAVPTSTVGYERRFNAALLAARQGEEAFVEYVLGGQPEPPPYFARMKRWNRDGPPLLDSLPAPERLSPKALQARADRAGGVVFDTRGDRRAFMDLHLRGSIHAPIGPGFPTVAGSYVAGEPIFFVASAGEVDGIVRDLVRVGLDEIAGWTDASDVAPEALAALEREERGELVSTPVLDMTRFESSRRSESYPVLDVRSRAEWDEGHVPGAIHVPHTQLRERLDEIPRKKPVFVHCGTGKRAASAVSLLEREGWRAILVDGRFEEWEAE
jgi:hydroxyacylglutathione hydrolase